MSTAAPKLDQSPAVRELADDHGRDLCACQRCWTVHFNSDTPCPNCGAGLYYQCWSAKDGTPIATHENYAKAYAQLAQRQRAQAERSDARASLHQAAAQSLKDAPQ